MQGRTERVLFLEELERRAGETLVTATEDGQEDDVSGGDVSGGDVSGGDAEKAVWEFSEDRGFLSDGSSAYGFSQLSAGEQVWYRDMEQALGVMSGKIKLSGAGIDAGLDETAVDKIFQCVLNDHPELFYVEGYNYTAYTRGDKTVAVEFAGTYTLDFDTVLARKLEIEQAVEDFLVDVPDTKDDYEKIKFVYEKIVRDTDYDLDSEENQNIYSVFVGHASVCQGYSKAFQYLLNRMGMQCTLVQGKLLETGEGHAWNLVNSNGDYYYVDTTWGDITYQSMEEKIPQISYDYLCITTAQMERTHALNRNMRMPACTAVKDNYFVRENALFDGYDREQMADLVNRRIERGDDLIALQCSSEECYELILEELLDNREIFSYLEGTGISSFAYATDDKQFTLTFFMMTSNG